MPGIALSVCIPSCERRTQAIALVVAGVVLLHVPHVSYAQSPGALVNPDARPHIGQSFSGDTGIFELPVPYAAPARLLTVSLFRSNAERAPQMIDYSAIGVAFGYGVSGRLEIFGALETNRLDADDLTQSGHPRDFPFISRTGAQTNAWITGLADTVIGAKYVMLDDRARVPDDVAAALRVTLRLPTADRSRGLGQGVAAFGADLLIARTMPGGAFVSGAFGFSLAGTTHGFDVGNAARWGVGVWVPTTGGARLALNAELVGQTYISGDCPRSFPVDISAGPSVTIGPVTLTGAATASFDREGRFANGRRWDPGYQLSLSLMRPAGRLTP